VTFARRALLPLLGALALSGCASFGLGSIMDLAIGSATGDKSSEAKVGALKQAASDTQKASEDFTPEQKYYIGRAVAATILGDPRYAPYDEPRSREYLNLLGVSLAWSSTLPETFAGWHVLVLDTEEINAFGAPEGFILVSRGLLRCAQSEDEAAAILAHEIGHVVLEHGIKAIDTARKAGAITSIAKAGLLIAGSPGVQKLTTTFGDVVGDIMKSLVNKGYSRDLEYQADAFAVALLAKAGYDPGALVRMLQVMQSKWKADGPGFMKTHPSPADRIKAVEKAAKEVPAPAAASPAARSARDARYKAALGRI
jgi:predicted Zn-dependent protease